MVKRCRNAWELIDRLGKAAFRIHFSPDGRFLCTSSRYEYLFWEMCYSMERWPV